MKHWLNLALGVVYLLSWITEQLDAASRRKVATALAEKVLRDEVDAILDAMRRAESGGMPGDSDVFRDKPSSSR
jgi:hypothetical protein